ncbi:MAG: hypothetical protein H7A46_02705 [Verrucomicrobiales bacterium]|nr:hypothetical protein [Verrucomicrobiales bacterium]
MLEARRKKVQRLTSDSSPHANCCQSFLRLWAEPATRTQAVSHWMDAETYLQSQNP